MDNLSWTTDKPTQSGYYWARGLWRHSIRDNYATEVIVLVRVDVKEQWAELPGTEITDILDSYTHWIGPLTVPNSPLK
jgi:hypothetical protein